MLIERFTTLALYQTMTLKYRRKLDQLAYVIQAECDHAKQRLKKLQLSDTSNSCPSSLSSSSISSSIAKVEVEDIYAYMRHLIEEIGAIRLIHYFFNRVSWLPLAEDKEIRKQMVGTGTVTDIGMSTGLTQSVRQAAVCKSASQSIRSSVHPYGVSNNNHQSHMPTPLAVTISDTHLMRNMPPEYLLDSTVNFPWLLLVVVSAGLQPPTTSDAQEEAELFYHAKRIFQDIFLAQAKLSNPSTYPGSKNETSTDSESSLKEVADDVEPNDPFPSQERRRSKQSVLMRRLSSNSNAPSALNHNVSTLSNDLFILEDEGDTHSLYLKQLNMPLTLGPILEPHQEKQTGILQTLSRNLDELLITESDFSKRNDVDYVELQLKQRMNAIFSKINEKKRQRVSRLNHNKPKSLIVSSNQHGDLPSSNLWTSLYKSRSQQQTSTGNSKDIDDSTCGTGTTWDKDDHVGARINDNSDSINFQQIGGDSHGDTKSSYEKPNPPYGTNQNHTFTDSNRRNHSNPVFTSESADAVEQTSEADVLNAHSQPDPLQQNVSIHSSQILDAGDHKPHITANTSSKLSSSASSSTIYTSDGLYAFILLRHLHVRTLREEAQSILNYIWSVRSTLQRILNSMEQVTREDNAMADIYESHKNSIPSHTAAHHKATQTNDNTNSGFCGLGKRKNEERSISDNGLQDTYQFHDPMIEVIDGSGVSILYVQAHDELLQLEKNLLALGTHYIRQYPANPSSLSNQFSDNRKVHTKTSNPKPPPSPSPSPRRRAHSRPGSTHFNQNKSSRKHRNNMESNVLEDACIDLEEFGKSTVDRGAVLHDLWVWEVAFLREKRRLIDHYKWALEHCTNPRQRKSLVQAIINVMYRRPYFDFDASYFAESYLLACERFKLERSLINKVAEFVVSGTPPWHSTLHCSQDLSSIQKQKRTLSTQNSQYTYTDGELNQSSRMQSRRASALTSSRRTSTVYRNDHANNYSATLNASPMDSTAPLSTSTHPASPSDVAASPRRRSSHAVGSISDMKHSKRLSRRLSTLSQLSEAGSAVIGDNDYLTSAESQSWETTLDTDFDIDHMNVSYCIGVNDGFTRLPETNWTDIYEHASIIANIPEILDHSFQTAKQIFRPKNDTQAARIYNSIAARIVDIFPISAAAIVEDGLGDLFRRFNGATVLDCNDAIVNAVKTVTEEHLKASALDLGLADGQSDQSLKVAKEIACVALNLIRSRHLLLVTFHESSIVQRLYCNACTYMGIPESHAFVRPLTFASSAYVKNQVCFSGRKLVLIILLFFFLCI